MKRSAKRLIVIILSLAMTLSLLAGCGNDSSESSASGTKTEAASSSAGKAETASSASGSESSAGKTGESDTAPSETSSSSETASVSEEAVPAGEEEEPADPADAEIVPELTEYFDEDTAYEIEFEGEAEPSGDAGASVEGTLGEVLAEDEELSPPTMAFSPLSESEIAAAAEEVRTEIEEAAEEAESSGSLAEAAADPEGSDEPAPAASGTTAGRAPKQLTIEDIQAMNPDSTVIDIYTNQGYLSTLVGKYYDKKVTNVEEGVLSIQPMASLLGLSKGCDFFAVYAEKNKAGYTFYTYQQRYGGYTLKYATLRVIVDPMGYTAGLSCSFIPNVGTASQEPAITKKQAEDIVRNKFADFNLTFYTDYTVRLAVPFNDAVYNCWIVYTNNPDATPSFDMPYIEHCVTTDGKYLTLNPTNDFAAANSDVQDNSGYFEGMDVQNYTTSFRLEDGTTRKITVPVSYNKKDKKYYLMDPSRKIAVAQYYDFNYRNTVKFVTSNTIDGWSKNNLMAYANYIICYDFYQSHGIRSIDGFGVPVLITVGWCDKNRTPVDNACFYGVKRGWACFGVSDANFWSDCVDVIGHEYTHGVTNQSMQGVPYSNETGAINESYSDIMGNLIEMSQNYTSDRTWLLGEKSGKPDRDMGNPNAYRQPAYVGDRYYIPHILYPDSELNDLGGVHVNNSLLGHIAYLMNEAGMTYEQQFTMWLTSIELITPRSDYQDVHGALLFSLKINGLLSKFGGALNQAFDAAGLNDNWDESYLDATKEGCGRIIFTTDETIASSATAVLFATPQGQVVDAGFPDEYGRVSLLLPAGTYIAMLQTVVDDYWHYYSYTGTGWYEDQDYEAFTISPGEVVELVGTSGKKAGLGGPAPQTGEDLTLEKFDAGFFSIMIPKGWAIETYGEYSYFGYKIYDPNDPSTQLFFFGGLSPLHKSEAARKFWAMYDSTGVIANGPVLSQHNILGILDCWNYCAEYQRFYDRQYFTELSDFHVRGANYYTGPSAKFNGIETACVTDCTSVYGDRCLLTMTSALIDDDIFNVYGGNWFYSCHDLCGILAPEGRYDDVFEPLLQCMMSLQFSQNYIIKSQNSDFPMAPQSTITASMTTLASVLYDMHEAYK